MAFYVNEHNVYAYKDAEGHWVFCRQEDINTDNYILKSESNTHANPYDKGVVYKKPDNTVSSIGTTVIYTPAPEQPDYTGILTEYAEAAEASASTASYSAAAINTRTTELQELSNLLTTIIG